ncbi:MAG: geranylgeranylglycerol-phosphate geranylgeranyltransferase [Acidilobaceae archaeon]|nr:geranylgeranylglycerol-phosphate geranylgeranyltransferase [Acidilobaceae archaeon]
MRRLISTAVALLELGRPPNALAGVLAVFLGASVISGSPPTMFSPAEAMLVAAASLLATFAVMTANDIVDLEADKINSPWRPLPSGRVSVRAAAAAAALYTALSILLSLFIEPLPTIPLLALSFLLAANAYNFGGKRVLLLGNLLVAFLTAFPIAVGALLTVHRVGGVDSDISLRAFLYWLMAFLSVLGREIAKGIPDVEGDLKAGVKTVANVFGRGVAARAAVALYSLSAAVSFLPPLLGLVNSIAYLAVVLPVNALVALESLRLLREPNRETSLSHKKRILALMVASMVGLYLGAAYHEP